MPKISKIEYGSLNKNQLVDSFINEVNNLTAKNLSAVKEMAVYVARTFQNELITMGKRALVVSCENIEAETSLDVVKQKTNALVKAISVFDTGVENQYQPEKEVLAYKRKHIMLRALKMFLDYSSKEECKDEDVLGITQELISKTLNIANSIEVNIVSKYAKGMYRDVYDKHFEFNEWLTKIVAGKKGFNNEK